jgi:Immunity protein 50
MSEDAGFEGSELVTNWFGYWPSLHDAEILSADFRRAIIDSGPGLYLKVHAFEMTREVTEKGYFKNIKHCIIELRFEKIADVDLRHFGHQNVIDGISLSFIPATGGSRRISVELESITEMQLCFSCEKAVVASLTPGLPSEGVYTR